MSQNTKLWGGVAGFGVLAAFSFFQYPSIFRSACYFQTYWLWCSTPGTTQKVLLPLMVLLFFILAGITAWSAWNIISSQQKITLRQIILPMGISLVLAFLIVPFGSRDMAYYFNAGSAVSQDINIFTDEWPREYVFVDANTQVSMATGFSYGPIAGLLFYGVYTISGGSILGFFILWKLLMIGGLFLTGYLLWLFFRRIFPQDIPKEYIFLFLGIQPFFLFEWVVNGHFDALWLVLVLAALLLATQNRWWLVFPLLTMGLWLKFIPLFLFPFFLLWWWQETNSVTWKKRGASLFTAGIVSIALTVVAWYPFWEGPVVFGSIIEQAKWAAMSLFSGLYYTFSPFLWAWFGTDPHWFLTRAIHGLLLLVVLYFLLPLIKPVWNILRKKKQWTSVEYVHAMFITLAVFLFFWQKSFWPWYPAWLLPFGIGVYLSKKRKEVFSLLVWLSVVPLFFYPLWASNWVLTGTDATEQLWFTYAVVFGMMGYPMYCLYRWRRGGYT